MKINELHSDDALPQVSLDDIKGGNADAMGGLGCCVLNFSTNDSNASTENETAVSNCWMNLGQGSRWQQRRKQRKQRRQQRREQRKQQGEL